MVVQAHPLSDSYNAALLERVVAGLRTAGVDPVVHRLGEGERPSPSEVAGTTRLVLVFPTWQAGLPAMLLDWIHELLGSGTEPLSDVEKLSVVTTGGSSWLRNQTIGEWGRRYLRARVRPRCATGASFEWLALYKIDRRSRPEIRAFLDRVETRFSED